MVQVAIMADEEQAAILRMVADKTITVEQGVELLKALEAESPPPRRPPRSLGGLIDEALFRGFGRAATRVAPAPYDDDFGFGPPPRPPRPPRPARPPRPPRPQGPPQRGPRMPGEGPAPGQWSAGDSGRQGLSFDELVELKTQGVPKAYIDEMRTVFPQIGLEELLQCRAGAVQPEYARQMLAILSELDIDELVELQAHGVTVDFVSTLRQQFPDLDATAIIEAAAEGVCVEDLDFFVDEAGRTRRGQDPEAPAPE
jgi:hypothetical protein